MEIPLALRRRTNSASFSAVEACHLVAPLVGFSGKSFAASACHITTTSVKGETIDAWYSGKTHGYDGAGIGIRTPAKNPADGNTLDVGTRTRNALLRSLRCHGERGFSILTSRWTALQHTTLAPSRIGDIVKAAPTSNTKWSNEKRRENVTEGNDYFADLGFLRLLALKRAFF